MLAVFFLQKDISEPQQKAIEEELNKSPLVSKSRYVDSQMALERFKDKFTELQGIVKNLDTNPFPPSFEVTFKEKALSYDNVLSFIQKVKAMPGIEDVQFNQDWVDRMQSFSRLAKAVGFFLGGILILASFFIISNIIKINVYSRKNEIEILRLVGATNIFIKIPFLIEGVVLGIIGGMFSLLLLLFLIQIFPIYLGSSLGVLNELINFRYLSFSQSINIIMLGGLIGFLGSMSSLSRFLKT